MYNCKSAVESYHQNEAKLPEKPDRERLGEMKDRMQGKIQYHLGDKSPKFLDQGSYAMRTLIRTPENDYDVDVGVAFTEADLANDNGIPMSSREAQEMILEVAGKINGLKQSPEIHNGKCVRIYYADGPHIDVPVYRILKDGSYEIASNYTWKASDPEAVTKWFNSEIAKYENGNQIRHVVRLMKKWAKNKEDQSAGEFKMPSGFVITKLVCDAFNENGEVFPHLDEAYFGVMKLIFDSLSSGDELKVYSPVIEDQVISSEIELLNMKSKLESSLSSLDVLFNQEECNEQLAMEAWGDCFGDSDFFDVQLEKSLNSAIITDCSYKPTQAVILGGDDRKA